ncbi:MAG: DUF1045 domain-containing protein [Rhodobacter sp.]|nr:DUF1045 domain-containing protein [Rhodobacter sp.]
MGTFKRFAVYIVPEGVLYRQGCAWLGWDMKTACDTPQPDIPGLPAAVSDLTAAPRRYGFHGTVKPPFRLAPGQDLAGLDTALDDLAKRSAAVECSPLEVRALRGFVALVPGRPCPALAALADRVVRELEPWRAAPDPDELARRRRNGLTPRQESLLACWGYPYVMDEFRFHLTLTGKLSEARTDQAARVLAAHFADVLAGPFPVGSLCLVGEAEDGRFHLIRRAPLTG